MLKGVISTVYDEGTRADVPVGAWIQPIRRGYIMECCDCDLCHRFDFRVHRGRAQFRAWRRRWRHSVTRKACRP